MVLKRRAKVRETACLPRIGRTPPSRASIYRGTRSSQVPRRLDQLSSTRKAVCSLPGLPNCSTEDLTDHRRREALWEYFSLPERAILIIAPHKIHQSINPLLRYIVWPSPEASGAEPRLTRPEPVIPGYLGGQTGPRHRSRPESSLPKVRVIGGGELS